ncbi:MerR family transcriptional regulator [Streptomyces showdoensis]|uniref:MerR family transcriptional regulator n=1 Tax=Streptomyces showdoensis TaxID=68268 RepID=A0A2P2GC53_STREW|nr:MerR family transcriptional regulator [Streptomyces showdoensis]KKZ68996.1 MerR family transcriptional regulator [Streptomyces showdoensis]
MSAEELWSIGELAERAGVTVKTVRFYSDRGLVPEAGRSGGGHRRYGPEALDRIRLIRALRTLDLPVPDVGRVLDRDDALEDVVAGRLREVGGRLAALRWQEASLRLLRDCTAEERAERLRLLGAVPVPPDTTALARFWRRTLPVRMPSRLAAAIVGVAVPDPPGDPTPAQVLAFARLHELVARAPAPVVHLAGLDHRPAVLYEGLGEAYALAATQVRAGRPPAAGEALDCFVAAYAAALGVRDTRGFRSRLAGLMIRGADPLIARYWELAAEAAAPASGPAEPTAGATHHWLCVALKTGPGTRPFTAGPQEKERPKNSSSATAT